MEVAVHALELEPVGAQDLERASSGEEMHLVASGGEAGAEHATHRAGANHGEAH
jgi:hypothetical protein